MQLLGKDITPSKLMAWVGERLAERGLSVADGSGAQAEGVEARVDPLSFNLQALEEHADATRALPLETHRDGVAGRAVTVAKKMFRAAGQVFINEALGRQRVFNGHVRDSYAQLAAEVIRLRARVVELEKKNPVEAVAVELATHTPVAQMPSFVEVKPVEAPVEVKKPKAKKPAPEKSAAPKKPLPKMKLVEPGALNDTEPPPRTTRRHK